MVHDNDMGGMRISASFLIAFAAGLAIVIATAVALFQLKSYLTGQALDNLQRVNNKVAFTLHRQLDEMVLDGRSLLRRADVRAMVLKALEKSADAQTRLDLRRLLASSLFEHHYRGFYLIGRNGRIVMSMKDADAGTGLPREPAEIIRRLDAGEQAIISHPFRYRGRTEMWMIMGISAADGGNIGYLAIIAGDRHRFTRTTSITGVAFESTETYLVDRRGYMLSESRFDDQLLATGLLQPGMTSTLNLRIADPGVNRLEQAKAGMVSAQAPLTLAVTRVLEEGSGWSTQPYRDYRGVPVMGAWQWDKGLNAAIITEVDVDEALAGYVYARNIIIALLLVVFLGGLLASRLYSRVLVRSERESNRHRNLLLESSAGGIYGIDERGRCTFINQAALNMLGYEEREVIGRNMHELIHYAYPDGDAYPIDECNIYRSHRQKTRVHCDDECFWHKDGHAVHVEYWSHPLFEEDRAIGSVVTFLDITPQLQAEREREKMENQVQHTQRLESLGVLAGGIAHDFNNLLAAILGNASLVESNILKDPIKAKERVAMIIQSAEKAGGLCKQLLAYSGKGQFILKPVDISKVVEEMSHLLEVSIDKSVVMKYHLAADLPRVMVDEAQVQQVILNLITNANDAIDGKSGVIAVTTGIMQVDRHYLADCYGNRPEPGRYIYVEVSDTGCGMSRETIRKVFDPFFTTKVSGRGLGMSAVLGIVRGHKGALKVYSEEGRGTTFKFLLPVDESVRLASTGETGLRQMRQFEGGTVLVVDDEETVREMACVMLEEMGFDTLTASNGEEALALYEQHRDRILLVLSDLTMPRMGGNELFSRLRTMDPDCRVILSSGYSAEDAIQQFSGKGLAGFIQKPYTAEALNEEVSRILGDGE